MGVMETNTFLDDIALIGERQAAARLLLSHPVLAQETHSEELTLVRTHSEWLVQRFQRVLGYELVVAADHARLVKRGLVRDVVQPFARPSGAHFSPRTYTYLALSLAVLVESPRKVQIEHLAARVRAAAEEAGLGLDPAGTLGERRAFVAALRRLCAWGVLAERSGALRDYQADATARVRLEARPHVARTLAAHLPHSDAEAETFLEQADDTDPDTEEAGEVALRRLLAETAVVYREDLPSRQRDRLAAHQWRAAAALCGLLGCDAEIRAEGVALIMPEDAAAGPRFPTADPVGQAALALLQRLTGALAQGQSPATSLAVPATVLEAALAQVTGAGSPLRAGWERSAQPWVPAPDKLAEQVLELLDDLGLLRREPSREGGGSEMRLTAAAARYGAGPAPRAPEVQDNGRTSDGGAPGPPDSGYGAPRRRSASRARARPFVLRAPDGGGRGEREGERDQW